MRQGIFWLVVVLIAGAAMFNLKFRVQTLEAELAQLNRALLADQEAMHVLAAEWSYLNRPERLARLNRRYLRLRPVAAHQLNGFAAASQSYSIPPTHPASQRKPSQ